MMARLIKTAASFIRTLAEGSYGAGLADRFLGPELPYLAMRRRNAIRS